MTSAPLQDDGPIIQEFTDDDFLEFCARNRDYRIERTADGKVIVMPGTGGKTGNRNLEISIEFGFWTRRDGRGIGFDSSTSFRLPNSAIRSPDAAWVSRPRLAGMTAAQTERFLPLCPEFVIELISPSDRLADVKLKMSEYLANGCEFGWLIFLDF